MRVGTVHFQVRGTVVRSRGVLRDARVVAGVRRAGGRDGETARPVAHRARRDARLR